MDLRRQFAVARSWAPLLIASVIISAVAAYLITGAQPRVYEAKTTLLVGPAAGTDYNQLLASQRLSATYASVATARPQLEAAIAKLGLSMTPDQLGRNVVASASQDTALITITVHDGDAGRAAAISNQLADELVKVPLSGTGDTDVIGSIDQDLKDIRAEIQATQAEIDPLSALTERSAAQQAQLDALEGRIVTLRSTYATLLAFTNNATNLVTIVQPAVAPGDPIAPRPLFNALLAAVAGLLVASAFAFLFEYLDDSIKDPEQVERLLGLPTLGSIMRMRGGQDRRPMYRLAPLLYPRSRDAEAYRILRTNLEFTTVDASLKALLVTSAAPAEGKSITAANLAIVFAQEGRKVLLLDADLRQPAAHSLFDIPNHRGLTTLLRSDELAPDSVVRRTEQEHLDVLPTGPLPPNPAELLASNRMKALVESLQRSYDLIVVDSPPLEVVTDAAILSSYLHEVVLVIDAVRSKRALVRRARETLTRSGAHVLGVCLNRVARPSGLQYGSYYSPEDETTSGAKLEPSRPS